jgi:hypothetical protein
MTAPRRPWHVWLVGALILVVWSQGAWDWLMMTTRNAGYIANVPADWQALVFGQPWWVSVLWVVAVWGLLPGAIGLWMRRRWAVWALGAAAVALVLDQAYVYVLHPDAAAWRAQGLAFPAILCAVMAAFALYAWAMAKRGVLR